MYRRLSTFCQSGSAGLSLLALTLGGCTQATRHSNMMIFGTNTVVGLSAGKDVDTPAITVGYKRQELVLMPLVANEKENSSRELVPCQMGLASKKIEWNGPPGQQVATETETMTGAAVDHPCLLAAVRTDGANKVAKDSYSVLASFGANFDAGVGTQVTAKGGLAQYFATGMAAQLLALSGGAAVVATGPAAQMSSAAKPDAGAVAVLTGDPALATALADPAIKAKAAGDALMNKNAAGLAAAYLAKIADGPEFIAEVGVLDGAAGLDGNLVFACAGRAKADCIGQIEGAFAGRDPSKISKAVLERVAAKGGIK